MNEISYARADDHHIAYRVMTGATAGGVDVVMFSGAMFPFEMLAEDRVASRFMAGLAALGRLVVFDKRGVGLSDPMTDWSRSAQEQWAEDLCAVVESAELEHPVVVAWDGTGVARQAVSMRPDLFGSMVLINPMRFTTGLAKWVDSHGEDGVSGRSIEKRAFPSRANDPDFWDWMARAGRSGASPATAGRIWSHMLSHRAPLTPPGITVRTLVLRNRDSMEIDGSALQVAAEIPGASLVEVPGADVYPIAGDVDPLVAEIAQFVTGAPTGLAPRRLLTAILFTDLVASTERAVEAGDQHWSELLDIHDRVVGRCVTHHGGRVVKFTGDGVLALLPSGTAALETAESIRHELASRSMAIRAGVHVGDVDVRGEDVSGISINIAARIMGLAGAGETIVSDAVCQATLGSGVHFEAHGPVQLKGIPDEFALHRLVSPT